MKKKNKNYLAKFLNTSRCVFGFVFNSFNFVIERTITASVIHSNCGIHSIFCFDTVASSTVLRIVVIYILINRVRRIIKARWSPFRPVTPFSPLNNCRRSLCRRRISCDFTGRWTSGCCRILCCRILCCR